MAKGGGSRDVSRRDFDLRFEERGRSSGWGVAPPSRHLWVGNLSPEVSPSVLSDQFLKFGDLEDISYVSGRSYAFVNYMKKDDAAHAMRALQGAIIEGMPLRIEFAKGEKPPLSSQDKEYQRYDNERHSHKHGDARPIQSGKSYDSSKGNKDAEPSEILWIGFPLPMNIDESVLRRAFSPFGEIERITTFPGRSYAFVQYRSVTSACRAKEALHGKLLDNPRIRVCFAKGDVPPDQGRSLSNVPHLPRFRSNVHPGPSGRTLEAFHGERGFESPTSGFQVSSPPFVPNFERMHEDSGAVGSGRAGSVQAGLGPGRNPGAPFEHIRLQEFGSHRAPGDTYERHKNSPVRGRDAPWDNPPLERRRRSPFSEDSWMAGDANFLSAKKLKTDSFTDRELPEYPFTEFEKNKLDSIPQRSYPSMHEPHSFNRNMDSLPFGLTGPNHPRNLPCPPAENDDSWRSSDAFNAGPAPPHLGSSKLQNFNSEYHQPGPLELWKWEGTIAKGGTPICRARCFPVGKVLDFMLPEFLDCTARTGLDMLAKHYYQAAGTWVVFFVPETDADIVFYNELLHYLSEKQRAAVAKLGDKISLFLVPPSEFSEQVLKVPGKMSISGLILKFQQSDSCSSSFHYPMDAMEFKLPTLMPRPSDGTNLREDASFIKSSSPIPRTSLGNLAPTSFPPHNLGDSLPYLGAIHTRETQPEFNMEIRHGQQPHQPQQPNPALKLSWSSDTHIPNPSIVTFPPLPPNAASHSVGNSMVEKYPIANPRLAPEASSGNYNPETSGIIHFPSSKLPQQQETIQSSSLPMPLQSEQLAQLAAFLGQHKQVGRELVSSTDASLSSNPSLISHASASSGPAGPQTFYPLPSIPAVAQSIHPPLPAVPLWPHVTHASVSPGMMADRNTNASLPLNSTEPQLSQAGSLQLHLPPDATGVHGNPALQSIQQAPNRTMEEGEPDPQKRLQATLQLAASLLQQIQQQSKN